MAKMRPGSISSGPGKGKYPITDKHSLKSAVRLRNHAKGVSKKRVRAHIIARAHTLGLKTPPTLHSHSNPAQGDLDLATFITASEAKIAKARAELKKRKAEEDALKLSNVRLVGDVELGSYGSKWRHEWVPLNAVAAAIKAKKFKASSRSSAKLSIRKGTYRGEAGHHITGKDARGRTTRVFAPGERAHAERAVQRIKAGQPAFRSSVKPKVKGELPRKPGKFERRVASGR